MTAPTICCSAVERVEQRLFDLLHLLAVAEQAALALVEQSLDPDGSAAQFFAACEVRHELQQAREHMLRAQQLLSAERSAQRAARDLIAAHGMQPAEQEAMP